MDKARTQNYVSIFNALISTYDCLIQLKQIVGIDDTSEDNFSQSLDTIFEKTLCNYVEETFHIQIADLILDDLIPCFYDEIIFGKNTFFLEDLDSKIIKVLADFDILVSR